VSRGKKAHGGAGDTTGKKNGVFSMKQWGKKAEGG